MILLWPDFLHGPVWRQKLDSTILMGPFHLGTFYDYEQLKDAREKYVRVCICSLRKYLFLAQPNLPL